MYHGFFENLELLRFLSWGLFSMSLIYAQLAVYQNIKNILVKVVFILKSTVLLYFSIQTVSFGFLIIDSIFSLFGFVVIGNLLFLKSISNYISYGILVSFASVFTVVYKINIHPEYLTQNDIGHYITLFSLAIMSKGIREDSLLYSLKIGEI
jgi:hypothetical protein